MYIYHLYKLLIIIPLLCFYLYLLPLYDSRGAPFTNMINLNPSLEK